MRSGRRRIARWGGSACIVLLLALYAANVPFYAGSTIGPSLAWRMEHGRLALRAGNVGHESFYVAINSEGLRFAPELRVHEWNQWFINVPLWIPLLACTAWTTRAWLRWRTARRAPGACPRCAYDLRSIPDAPVCPECGMRSRTPPREP